VNDRLWAWLIVLGVALLVWGEDIMAAIKPGVTFGPELKPTTQRMIDAAEFAYGSFGIRPTITEAWATDGHMAGSRHYSGDALDFRIWESNAAGVTAHVVTLMRGRLGADYDVVLEATHIHVEYDPQ
jgi:hypothetical protein